MQIDNEFLNSSRKKIDAIDESIVKLLIDRFSISGAVINEKLRHGMDITDIAREEKIKKSLREQFESSLDSYFIDEIYNLILKRSKAYYYKHTDFISLHDALENKPVLIAGPCAVESDDQIDKLAEKLSGKGIRFLRGGAFKPRTSPHSFTGLGKKGLEYIYNASRKHNMYVVSEIMDSSQLDNSYDFIDVIQIGSRNMSSFELLKIVGKETSVDKKPVLLKRGFYSTLKEFLLAAEYILNEGNPNVILCLRGIRTFEQIDSDMRYTPDLGAIAELKKKTKLKVFFDPSHASGDAGYICGLSKAALALDIDGLMIETHDQPENAVVDGKQSVHPDILDRILSFMKPNG